MSDITNIKELYEKFGKQLFYFAYRNLKSESLAKDIVQDVFTTLCSKNIESINNIQSYIFRIARNKIVDTIRQQARDRVYREKIWEEIEKIKNTTYNHIIEKEYQAHYCKATKLLTPQQKTIFNLSRVEGLSHDEIAKELNLSPNTVKNHITSALKVLKRYFLDIMHLF